MDNVYRIEIGTGDSNSSDYALAQQTFATLDEARAALTEHNGGELYGDFDLESVEDGWITVEGWNLGPHELCETAVILRKK